MTLLQWLNLKELRNAELITFPCPTQAKYF